MTSHLPPHQIQTQRLTLRSGRAGDGAALRDLIGVSLNEFFPWLSFSKELESIEKMEEVSQYCEDKFQAGEFYVWRAWESDEVMVGSVDLHSFDATNECCEIGYWLRTDRTGRGLAKEFVNAVIKVAHENLHVKRIEARCDVRNERAWRLAESLGFKLESIAENDGRDAAGQVCSHKIYVLHN